MLVIVVVVALSFFYVFVDDGQSIVTFKTTKATAAAFWAASARSFITIVVFHWIVIVVYHRDKTSTSAIICFLCILITSTSLSPMGTSSSPVLPPSRWSLLPPGVVCAIVLINKAVGWWIIVMFGAFTTKLFCFGTNYSKKRGKMSVFLIQN